MKPPTTRKSGSRTRPPARGQDRRSEILAAAVEIVVADGYARTSVSQVSRRAGVPRPLVQYYFPTRELMLRAAIDKIFADWEARYFAPPIAEAADAVNIAAGVERLWAHMHDPAYRAVQELRSAARTDPTLAAIMDELHETDSHRRREQAMSAFAPFSSADPAAFVAARAFTTIFLEGLLEHRFGNAEESSDPQAQLAMLSMVLTTFWAARGILTSERSGGGRTRPTEIDLEGLRALAGEMVARLEGLAKSGG